MSILGLGLGLALAACEERGGTSAAPPSRVNAAKVSARQGSSVEAFCDVHFKNDAPAFQWPALAPGETAPAAAASWRWVNVWATWCKPCIEEMPRLQRWRDQLARSPHPVDLVFVSVDEAAADVDAFRTKHPETPPSLRLADPDNRALWFRAVGLDGDPPIPIHVFVDPKGHVRCARAGGVREKDFAIIEQLLRE